MCRFFFVFFFIYICASLPASFQVKMAEREDVPLCPDCSLTFCDFLTLSRTITRIASNCSKSVAQFESKERKYITKNQFYKMKCVEFQSFL